MSLAPSHERLPSNDRLKVPDSLQQQLHQFRRRVWSTKMMETICMAIAGWLFAYCVVFALDRFVDTPQAIRLGIFATIVALWASIPWAFHRWVWKNRKLEQLAKLLRRRDPGIGDQLLGVIELAESDREQNRSRTLCAAAMQQVAEAAQGRDLCQATPKSHHRLWSIVALGVCGLSIASVALFPAAAMNAWSRVMSPWSSTPRYTFTMINEIPSTVVVAHGEPADLVVELAEGTQWRPVVAKGDIQHHQSIEGSLLDSKYVLPLPPLTTTTQLHLRIGDYMQTVNIEPKLRPELSSLDAKVTLPNYLEVTEPQIRDARAGSVSAVVGSTVTLQGSASRALAKATLDGNPLSVNESTFSTSSMEVPLEGKRVAIEWHDADRLAGREPFHLMLQGRIDEQPSVTVEDLPRKSVVLDSEQISFKIFAGDDFGIKRVGIEWQGLDDQLVSKVAHGERVLAKGGPDQGALQVQSVFCAKDNNIEPQPIDIRVWVEDYLPERGRIYSMPFTLFVLSPDDHEIYISEQFSKLQKQVHDVHDREMQLYESNKQLREMDPNELGDPENRKRLETQAAAEASNGRRLNQLSKAGEEILRKASRNPEIGVGHLEKIAETLQVLKDIAGNRMPSVEDLLKQAATAPQKNSSGKAKSGLQAGQNRETMSPKMPETEPNKKADEPKPSVPSVADRESTQQPPDESDPGKKKESKGGGRLGLAQTTITGPPPKPDEEKKEEEEGAKNDVATAVKEQEDLLAEFEKIMEELNNTLGNLEGSTLVKRLKAASREQLQIAGKISDRIDATFGRSSKMEDNDKKALADLTQIEGKSVQTMSNIMDDMQAYFERRRLNPFKLVLEDMRQTEVLSALRTLGDEIPKEQGMSIAQAEFWSDTFDRWADDLVDPACKGNCPGGKSPDSLPPSIVLEVLQILEGEVNLREETRVAEQAKAAVDKDTHEDTALDLSEKQDKLQFRIQKVVTRIYELEKPEENFGKELQLLAEVDDVMGQASNILSTPETGAPAIAAETEAIELLLKSKRINPKGGGGGGSSPGGGGKGDTSDSALALIGTGVNEKEHRERREVIQSSGENGRVLPEEYRTGLDEYFNRLEGK